MIEECEGYQKLHKAIIDDTRSGRSEEERLKVLQFAVDRAKHYEEKTGIPAGWILTRWENRRKYWYMNYYQDANQPKLDGKTVRVFENVDALKAAFGKAEFRCPHCKGVTSDPYECNSGVKVPLIDSGGKAERCNWKVYGLFADLGGGVYVFVKEEMKGELIFKPLAWEEKAETSVPDSTEPETRSCQS